MIIWNGVRSDDVGVIVEHYPQTVFPQRKVEVISIPGGNGDIIIDREAYENYDQSYSVFLDTRHRGGMEIVMQKLSDWLYRAIGYQKLEDDYFPDFYRMACVKNAGTFSNLFNEYGQGVLTFNCAPQRYYRTGDKPVTIQNGSKIAGLSRFQAYPVYHFMNVVGTPTMTLNEDGKSRSVTLSKAGSFYLDSKSRISGDNYDVNKRAIVGNAARGGITGDFSDLRLSGETTVSWSGGTIGGLEIIPRWWTV